MFAPTVERLASETGLPLVSVNIDENPGLASAYGVQGVPTLILLEDGQEVARQIGGNTLARTSAALGLS